MELWGLLHGFLNGGNLGYFTPVRSHESPSMSDMSQENRFFPLGRIPENWDVSTINPRSNGVDGRILREN